MMYAVVGPMMTDYPPDDHPSTGPVWIEVDAASKSEAITRAIQCREAEDVVLEARYSQRNPFQFFSAFPAEPPVHECPIEAIDFDALTEAEIEAINCSVCADYNAKIDAAIAKHTERFNALAGAVVAE